MGWSKPATDRETVEVVAIGTGKVTGPWSGPKARLWLLGNRTMVLVRPHPSDPKEVVRTVLEVETASNDRRAKRLSVTTFDQGAEGPTSTWSVSTAGCGCGLGVISSVGPIDGPYRSVRIRPPEWYTVI